MIVRPAYPRIARTSLWRIISTLSPSISSSVPAYLPYSTVSPSFSSITFLGTGTYGDDSAFQRFFFSRIGDDNTGSRNFFGLCGADNYAVSKRFNVHSSNFYVSYLIDFLFS